MKDKDFNVLIVDDDVHLVELLLKLLEDERYELLTAYNGQDAFKIVSNRKIDFVVTDIRMPKGDGISLVKNIKNKIKNPPQILVISGYSDFSKKEVFDLGVVDFIEKPFGIERVSEYVERGYQRIYS